MLQTRVINLNTASLPWHFAHIKEHLLIEGFLSVLETSGFNCDLFGWIEGETFEDCMFIEAGFYNPRAAEIFDKFMRSPNEVHENHLNKAIKAIASEERAAIVVADIPALLAILQKGIQKHSDINTEKHVTVTEKPAQYLDVSICIQVESLTAEQQKVFLRLRVILIDIIRNYMSETFSGYSRGSTELSDNKYGLEFSTICTITKKLADITKISNELQKHLHTYDIGSNMQHITDHFTAFTNEPLWQTQCIDYFRHTGINATNAEIALLATQENIEAILTKIKITAHVSTDDDYELIG